MSSKALEGIKVAALIQGITGPLTAATLASHGAQVLRIESHTRIEWHRQAGPFIGGVVHPDRSALYLIMNPGSYGITLNLKHPRAMEVMSRIIKWVDVVVENFAGGVMKRTGFPDQMPQFPGMAITDFIAPRANVLAIVAALDYRRKTGKGQFIDAAQMESAIPLLGPVLLQYEANGEEAGRTGNRSSYAAPHGVYRCKGENRWCAITVFSDEEWGNFCQVIGKPTWTESPEFATLLGRLENVDELDRLVEEWTLDHSPEEVLNLMQGVGVAAGVVQSGKDLDGDPQLKHRHFYWDFDQPEIGKFTYSGLPAQLSKTPYAMKPAPMLGEHNEYVYTQLLGMSDEEFIDLMADGVFE
jgi:benzylsuccinate CoA-transferase BbsF subunit